MSQEPKDRYGNLFARGKIPIQANHHIPDDFFQHPNVQAKLDEMRIDESINASNRQRIPEKYPFSTAPLMEAYLNKIAEKSLPVGSYLIGIKKNKTNSIVYFESIPVFELQPDPKIIKFKIHLMFNVKYMEIVIPRLFNMLKETGFPVIFKLLNFNPVTAIVNRAGAPNPLFTHHVTKYDYGTNSAKKSKHRRLAESFIYSPTEIKKYQVTAHFNDPFKNPEYAVSTETTSTFTLDGTTKDGKVIKERYNMETVFDPVIVFYTDDKDPDYTQKLLGELLRIFPDDDTREWVLPNFYPRGNVKINNMIYLANGDFGTKFNPRLECKYNYFGRHNPGAVCYMDENYKLLNIPPEYQTIQDSCSSLTPEQCNAANRLPLAVSNHKLCKLEKVGNEEQCKPQKTYSQHLLLQDYNSLEELYDAVGQRAVLEGFKAGTENASLPTNYGGRRTRRKRNKQSRKKNKNKSRRAH
jgi:hypothetical protein